MTTMIGYARVSTTDQSLEIQLEKLTDAGCVRVFSEHESASTTDRAQLQAMLEYVREGDVLLVTRLDRLARSVVDLRNIISTLERKGVGFRCLQQGEIDTTTSSGRLMLNLLGAFAEFELDIRRERQLEGVAKAKAAGKYKGSAPKADPEAIRALQQQGLGAREIGRRLKIDRKTVYRRVPDGWGEQPKHLRVVVG